MRVTQLLASAHKGDATGDAALALAQYLNGQGLQADVFALDVDAPLRDDVRPFAHFEPPGHDDVTVLHFNLPSPLAQAVSSYAGRRVLIYHNLTPPELLLPHCPDIARLTALGRRQLDALARDGCVDLAVGVSRFNTADLKDTGFASTATAPLMVDLRRFDATPNPILDEALRGDTPTFLTVGRVAPNKRLEDFLKIAAYYLRYVSPNARFVVVGTARGLEPYLDSLAKLHADLRLDERVRFVGRVSLADLIAYYRHASVYLCLSAHEGFCVPLLEAMKFGVPILARRAAAVPETLGAGGVLADCDDPAEWAEMLHLLATDNELRDQLAIRGSERLRAFEPRRVAALWHSTLTSVGRTDGTQPSRASEGAGELREKESTP